MEGDADNENNLFGVANNLQQSIRTFLSMAGGNNRDENQLDDSDYDDDDDDDDVDVV